MISNWINSIFILLMGNSMQVFLDSITNTFGMQIYAPRLLCLIFVITFICFLFRIIYKFKCALFGRKKRKKER